MSRKLIILSVLLTVGLWRSAGLLERLGTLAPGKAIVDQMPINDALRRSGIELAEQHAAAPRAETSLRNGFSMKNQAQTAQAADASMFQRVLDSALGGAGEPSEGDGSADAAPRKAGPPKPGSIVRVRAKEEGK